MKYLVLVILIALTSAYKVTKTYKSGNYTSLGDLEIDVEDVEFVELSKGYYSVNGFVKYSNWPSCSQDVSRYGLRLLCIASDEELDLSIFTLQYSVGITVNCRGNRIDGNWGYEIEEPDYFGCCVTDGDGAICVTYTVNGYIVWAIVVVVIVILCCICGCSFYVYKKRKQPKVGESLTTMNLL